MWWGSLGEAGEWSEEEEEKRSEQGFLAGGQPVLGGIRHSGTGRATACVDAGGHRRRVNCQLL